jgi:hypothetical protein
MIFALLEEEEEEEEEIRGKIFPYDKLITPGELKISLQYCVCVCVCVCLRASLCMYRHAHRDIHTCESHVYRHAHVDTCL